MMWLLAKRLVWIDFFFFLFAEKHVDSVNSPILRQNIKSSLPNAWATSHEPSMANSSRSLPTADNTHHTTITSEEDGRQPLKNVGKRKRKQQLSDIEEKKQQLSLLSSAPALHKEHRVLLSSQTGRKSKHFYSTKACQGHSVEKERSDDRHHVVSPPGIASCGACQLWASSTSRWHRES